MRPLTVGGLFSGIGGFELGMQRAGFEIIWMCEIDPFCQKVLRKHWPGVKVYNDVKEIKAANTRRPDVIIGGFPCQPHSVAGKRRGSADDRDLWPEYRRVIAELQPSWVIGENVPGIIGTILDSVLSDLESLSYEVQALTFPAAGFNAPHIRDRVFILGYSHRAQRWEKLQGNFPHREDPGREKTSNRFGVSGEDGRGGILADADRGISFTIGDIEPTDSISGNTLSQRLAVGKNQPDNSTEKQPPIIRTDRRPTEPGMGRDFDGIPSGLDGDLNVWSPGWENGVARVITGVPNRIQRLSHLGNAVVPQTVEFIGRKIKSLYE